MRYLWTVGPTAAATDSTEAEATGLSHGQALSLVALMGRIPRAAAPAGGLARAMIASCGTEAEIGFGGAARRTV